MCLVEQGTLPWMPESRKQEKAQDVYSFSAPGQQCSFRVLFMISLGRHMKACSRSLYNSGMLMEKSPWRQ
ncbi:hypothetical protein DOTSEDRAFT_71860 [Dothistroma septosporum NZE10]|uniref:Uncharacterized protein n=1 Tax=Dothistroma septosporum (strain NZE10 / CBS 128990) TaxID=675120 RepID=N1PP06_DOTSN|nr:hypothetical protein DOTSEDRAFT_71860 [Dothistroma septosporum NZE10]